MKNLRGAIAPQAKFRELSGVGYKLAIAEYKRGDRGVPRSDSLQSTVDHHNVLAELWWAAHLALTKVFATVILDNKRSQSTTHVRFIAQSYLGKKPLSISTEFKVQAKVKLY
ncbi:MAG: hypothetical protein HC852_15110 [Acaryochloridaceae cyanobacterium RU_4_10]|nr:hypothetical protein [Acaryochloridaceae cyanobacterium RU_4_10]